MKDVVRVVGDLDLPYMRVVENRIVSGCPFKAHEHDFEHPGFSVFTDTGHWICFKGCGQGDMVELVSVVKEITLAEARKWLLKHIHVDMNEVILRLGNKESIVLETPNYFQSDYDMQDSTKTSVYILQRGFTKSTVKIWGVRIDKVIHCLVIPIYSIDNELVGIVRREVPGYELPTRTKYWYSPGFSVSDHLFGANVHRPLGSTILVEGPLDVMRLHQFGHTNAVALLGAHCSNNQQKLLAKLGNVVYTGLDMDEAGLIARKKIIKDLSGKFVVKVINWPEKDPGECSQEQVDEAIQQAGFTW